MFVERLSGPVLQMLGTKWVTKSSLYIPTYVQEKVQHRTFLLLILIRLGAFKIPRLCGTYEG